MEDTITISKKEYEQLLECKKKLKVIEDKKELEELHEMLYQDY